MFINFWLRQKISRSFILRYSWNWNNSSFRLFFIAARSPKNNLFFSPGGGLVPGLGHSGHIIEIQIRARCWKVCWVLGEGRLAQHSPTFHINWFWSDARRLVVTSLRLIFAMAATKSQPGRDGDELQPGSAPSFTQHLHWKVGKFYADADGFIEYLIFAVGWLGRMEIGNPSMITLTFEVWHLKQLCQGESDIDAIFVLMVAVSAASVTCVEVSISAAGCDGQYRHYRHRFRGYQDSWPGSDKIRPGPGDTR